MADLSNRSTQAVPVLAVNAGSTSMKVELVDGARVVRHFDGLEPARAACTRVDLVAHRVVHGGARTAPAVVDDALVEELDALVPLAPLHEPSALDALSHARAIWPHAVHVACFDTAFHATIPPAASTYALPARLRRLVRVYGFHGLAHEWASRYVAREAPEARRVVVAHLGGGQSLCAVHDGQSVATTMGFSPLDGLVMASRPGRLDPGAVLWLAEHTDEDLADVFAHESGFVGLCGTADVREVLARADSGDPEAVLAREVATFRLVSEAGAMVAALGGLDALAFSGGVGEHATAIRRSLAEGLAWLGVAVEDPDPPPSDDGDATGGHPPDGFEITGAHSTARVFVVHARESLVMAGHARRIASR